MKLKRGLSPALILLASSMAADAAQQVGRIQSGETPIAFSTMTLYSAGSYTHAAPTELGRGTSDASGRFKINYTAPSSDEAVLYIIADGGYMLAGPFGNVTLPNSVRLATVIGSEPTGKWRKGNDELIINERTTTATAYAMAWFIDGGQIGGKWPGLQNAAAILQNLVDIHSGGIARMLGTPPNGNQTTTMRQFNSLANMLAACVNAPNTQGCTTLFNLATPPGGTAPPDTLQAAVNIAHNTWQNAAQLFQLSQQRALYKPALSAAPDAWTVPIRYDGNGHELDGPGNVVFDQAGNAWITNNYMYNPNPMKPSCGSLLLSKLTPTGKDAPGAPFSGGGMNSAGFGVTIDPFGDVWVGNFGFAGTGCDEKPLANSVSKFTEDGTPLSPDNGFTQGNISYPQGTVSDLNGSIWMANCGNQTVTQYYKGNPADNKNFGNLGITAPFGLAIDLEGNAWVTGNSSSGVAALGPDGTPLPGSPFTGGGLSAPLGVAVDSLDNVWVANSGGIPIAYVCGGTATRPPGVPPSVTQIRRNGQPMRSFSGGGITLPWGISVDGNDHIWVTNFDGQRLTELCGARTSTCPPNYQTGQPISPSTGYSFDGLTRNTAAGIDPSGNVWVANNWLNTPYQTNPGGHQMVVFVGLAAPVKSPQIGPPQQP